MFLFSTALPYVVKQPGASQIINIWIILFYQVVPLRFKYLFFKGHLAVFHFPFSDIKAREQGQDIRSRAPALTSVGGSGRRAQLALTTASCVNRRSPMSPQNATTGRWCNSKEATNCHFITISQVQHTSCSWPTPVLSQCRRTAMGRIIAVQYWECSR
jgi:hypothetical protein